MSIFFLSRLGLFGLFLSIPFLGFTQTLNRSVAVLLRCCVFSFLIVIARKMVYFCEEIGNLCPTNWFKQGSIKFFFRNKLNLGKKLNVNFARISKTPPLHKIGFSLFSRSLKFKIKTRIRNSPITRKPKIVEDKSKVLPEIWKQPKSEKESFRISYTPKRVQRCFRISDTPNSAKMFPNFGFPQTLQRCFPISDTPNSAKMFLPRSAELFISYESRIH